MRGAGPRDARGRFVRAAPRRSANLRVIGNTVDHVEPIEYVCHDGVTIRARSGVPMTRGDCPRERPCVFVRCKYNIAREAGADRQGRRHYPGHELPPTIKLGTLRGKGPSCTLDVTDAHPAGMTSGQVAKLLGITKRAVELIVKKARDRYHADTEDTDPDREVMESFPHPAGNGAL